MTFKLEHFAVAEGATTDIRGSLTLVGFNPPALVVERLPAPVSPHMVLVAEDDAEAPAMEVGAHIVLSVKDPDDQVLFLNQGNSTVQPPSNPNFPRRLQVIAQLNFTAPKPGVYIFEIRVSIGGTDPTEIIGLKKMRIIEAGSSNDDATQ